MSGKIDVRVRHEADTTARLLTTWEIDDLSSIIATLKQWGISSEDGSSDDFYGQFVDNGSDAFFEVIYS